MFGASRVAGKHQRVLQQPSRDDRQKLLDARARADGQGPSGRRFRMAARVGMVIGRTAIAAGVRAPSSPTIRW